MIPPTRLDERDARRARRADAQPGRAARRPARAAGGAAARRAADRGALRAPRPRARSRRRWTSCSPTRSAASAPAIAALPDGRYEATDVLETADGRARAPRGGHDRRRRARDRLRRHGAAARRQPQLPARGHALGLLLRRPLPHRSGRAGLGGAFAPVTRHARPRAASSTRARPAAVAAGNIETSSRIVDVLFRAFGQAVPVPAQGQGTMNNVILGNDRFTYYETIGGGQGACPDADGPSGVHVAMSNTLIDADRGARARVSAARRALRAAARLGRRGRCTAAATASSASCASSRPAGSRCSPSGAGSRRRAPRAARTARRAGTASNGEELPPFASRDARAGRRADGRDARRRRLRAARRACSGRPGRRCRPAGRRRSGRGRRRATARPPGAGSRHRRSAKKRTFVVAPLVGPVLLGVGDVARAARRRCRRARTPRSGSSSRDRSRRCRRAGRLRAAPGSDPA